MRQQLFGTISCFVSIGGHDAATGLDEAGYRLGQGLLQNTAPALHQDSGLLAIYMAQGIPVMSLVNLRQFCTDYSLPYDPVTLLKPGQSALHVKESRPMISAILALALCCLLMMFYQLRARKPTQMEETHMNKLQYLLERAEAAPTQKRRLILLLQALAMLTPAQREQAESQLSEHLPILTSCEEALHEQDADSGAAVLGTHLLEQVTPELLDQLACVLSSFTQNYSS